MFLSGNVNVSRNNAEEWTENTHRYLSLPVILSVHLRSLCLYQENQPRDFYGVIFTLKILLPGLVKVSGKYTIIEQFSSETCLKLSVGTALMEDGLN